MEVGMVRVNQKRKVVGPKKQTSELKHSQLTAKGKKVRKQFVTKYCMQLPSH